MEVFYMKVSLYFESKKGDMKHRYLDTWSLTNEVIGRNKINKDQSINCLK